MSAESTGSQAIWMGLITIPPGGRTKAHYHAEHETALYMLEGIVDMWYGEQLEHYDECRAGDYIYIPAGVPHVAANRSPTSPALVVGARTDPNEQESVVLTPELDALVPSSPPA
ncbi:MAG TPA: cupin domain-containing protein [Thermomicrobiales bacterium]|nr:cupin domain-containing protein [Thermomicrobiales bacterium]